MDSKNSASTGNVTGSNKYLVSEDMIKFKKGGWWQRRSTMERVLMVVLALALIAVVALVIAFVVHRTMMKGKRNVCMTPDCIKVASRIMDSIDDTVKPCDNFYDFACGTWNRKNVIPEDKSSYGIFSQLDTELEVILKNILEKESSPDDLEAFTKAQALYKSCMNETRLTELGNKPLIDFLPLVGVWPVLSSTWTDANFNLEQLLIKLIIYSNYPIIDIGVYPDDKNSDKNILSFDQPRFGMPGQKYYQKGRNDTMVLAYENLAIKTAVMLGADKTTAEQDMKDMVDFEMKLANISVPAEERRDTEKLYNLMTLANFSQTYPGFDWMTYVRGIMSRENVKISIPDDEPIINYSPPYYEQLIPLLNETPKRTITNYAMWRIVMYRLYYLSKPYRDLLLDYGKVISGTSTETARWKTCVSFATFNVGKAVGRHFIKEAFDREAKADMLVMIKNLKSSFSNLLATNEWMDDTTRDRAEDKLDAIKNTIGYNEKILNDTYVNMEYENYTYSDTEYFNNVLVNLKEDSAYHMRQLRLPVDKEESGSVPSIVNAFYSPLSNEIVFPAGILQPPFYHKKFPQSLNYGGIGVIIGHEITHGFDDLGRQYDKSGNLREWWTKEVIQRFKNKTQCIIEQYGDFTVPEANMQVNGINTQGENIADNGGLKQSFQAYRNWVKQRGKEEDQLPGLDFTPNQLFFLNFAQVWCGNMRKESAINRILSGVHSPRRFRVLGTLRNSPDFAEAFSCAPGSYMNPNEKCEVW